MAERYAVATGNWSAVGTWDGGASLPGSGDTVHANTYTVTIDQDVTVVSLNTIAGAVAVAGGGFSISSGTRTVNANIVGGTTTCLIITNAATGATINGNCTAGSVGSQYGVQNLKLSGTVTINGNCTGGPANNAGALNGSSGTLNINGNCTGGNNASSKGAQNNSNGTLNIVGDCIADTIGRGALNAGSGTTNITGNCIGGSGSTGYGAIHSASTGTLNVYGSAIGGSHNTGYGLYNQNTGTCTVTKAVGHATTGAVGAYNASTGSLTVTNTEYGANGIRPVGATAGSKVFFANPATASAKITKSDYSTATIGGASGFRGVNVNGGATQ